MEIFRQNTADLQARLDKLVNETIAESQTDINALLKSLTRRTVNQAHRHQDYVSMGSKYLENTNLPAVIEDSMSLKQV